MAATSAMGRAFRHVLAFVVAVSLSGACIWVGLRPPDDGVRKKHKAEFPPAVLACTADEDCQLVERIGCCSCSASGAQWAINREQTDTIRRFLKKACGLKAPCVQMDACRPDLVPACIEGQCAVRVAPHDREVHDG